jgi:nitrite reductase/ring-hydroxylating ferredoxin subunit/DMSO/TMAO reductase YedYZ heme-binding membrane subunit
MSHAYRAVGWNPQKRAYDLVAAAGAASVTLVIAAGTLWLQPFVTAETVLLRAFGGAAFVLLHVVLSIGPACRLDRRLLPLLYNRRHLGVLMFLLAAVHAVLATIQFHGFGNRHPLVSLLTTSDGWLTVERFPFQIAGLAAFAILFVMAATSHDFWLRTLTAPVWKAIHMCVYLAYAALVAHVVFGVLQSEVPRWAGALVGVGAGWLALLHTLAARKEAAVDREPAAAADGFVDVCGVDDIPDTRARIVCAGGERVAIFRYGDRVSALSNVCQHQNGPLGEGKIVGGCVVCPWHGYEYRPDTGASPPPFTEAVPTFRVQLRGRRVFLDPRPLSPGTFVEPAIITS